MEKYYYSRDSSKSKVIVVPIFAFVGGTTRHMHRFNLRRNNNSKKADAVANSNNVSPTFERENSDNLLSKQNGKNRYLNNFDQIRMIHHWYLSEIGKWFVHAEIGDYCDGGIGLTMNKESENKQQQQEVRKIGNNHHLDDEVAGDADDDENFFPRATSSTCLMLRTASDGISVPQTPVSSFATKNNPNKSGTPSRLWFRWRRRANLVVKLVRSSLQNSSNDENSSSLSPLTPIVENINMDRSINFAHQAVQLWLDAIDLHSTCFDCLPVDLPLNSTTKPEFDVEQSSMMRFTSSEDMTMTNGNNNNNNSFASALQRRRQEKARKFANTSSFRKTNSNGSAGVNNLTQMGETHLNSADGAATSSGDDCGGSVGFEEHDSESSSTASATPGEE